MKTSLMFQTCGVMLLFGCTIGTAFAIAFWLLLPLTFMEGVGVTVFFVSLSATGYAMFKYDYGTYDYINEAE
jgi:hypothetical protein